MLGLQGHIFAPKVLLFIGHLYIGKVSAQGKQFVGQQLGATFAIVRKIVAIAGLSAVNIPVAMRVTRRNDLVHQHQRTTDHGAAALGGVEEGFFVHLQRLGVVADKDNVYLVVVPGQKKV